eukprot:5221655-Prymnesium_polylepis.1
MFTHARPNVRPGISSSSEPGRCFEPQRLKWVEVGANETKNGKELDNQKLAKALQSRTQFIRAELKKFGINELTREHFVKSGDKFFKPGVHRQTSALHGFLNRLLQSVLHRSSSKRKAKKEQRSSGLKWPVRRHDPARGRGTNRERTNREQRRLKRRRRGPQGRSGRQVAGRYQLAQICTGEMAHLHARRMGQVPHSQPAFSPLHQHRASSVWRLVFCTK